MRLWHIVSAMRQNIPDLDQWHIFTGKQYGRATKKEARVTLGSFGTFYLNEQAFVELGSPAAVELLFDVGRRRIGLRPVAPMAPHAFKILPHTKGNYHRLSAAAFCHHHRIFHKGTLLFHGITIDETGMIRLDLVNATVVTRGAR
jgi:hypothetical protein